MPPRPSSTRRQMRAMLVPQFTKGRMLRMKTRVERHVDDLLDQLAASTPPADLHRALSFPLPTMTICDLLGVPLADRQRIGQWAKGTFDQSDDQHSGNTFEEVVSYITELVGVHRPDRLRRAAVRLRDYHLAAVEEVMRLGVGGNGSNALIPRYAHADIAVGDTVITAGDAVMLAIGAANYDNRAFPDADLFDLAGAPDHRRVRGDSGHLLAAG
jgi:pentalenolactone synthase